jgi:hypothetical protein
VFVIEKAQEFKFGKKAHSGRCVENIAFTILYTTLHQSKKIISKKNRPRGAAPLLTSMDN